MPEYTKQIVGFYDILGFSAYVSSHPNANDVHRLFQGITRVTSVEADFTATFGQRSTHFSDTVIRTTPFVTPDGQPNGMGILFQELIRAVHFQMELVWQELCFVRGAISVGQAFHDDGGVYGPAIIRAYSLESEIASFPRIIIDPELIALLNTSEELCALDHTIEMNVEDCYRLLRRGEDGIWFIDYLLHANEEADYEDQYPQFLMKHRRMILAHLGGANKVDRVTQKFFWLADYHNDIVSKISESYLDAYCITRNSLLISNADAPLYHPPNDWK